jgi:hypothetical protein
MDRAADRCYHRVVPEIAGNQREIGGLALVFVAVLVPGLSTTGCYYSNHPISPDPGDGSDAGAGSDTGSAGTDPDTCFGAEPFHVCLEAAPDAPFSVSPGALQTINTASDLPACMRTVSGVSNACVVAATTITIAGTLRATGPRPLILIARDSISIQSNGSIDVGSHRGAAMELGAGADPQDCVSGVLPDTGCGGAGGSFVGLGGMGAGMQAGFCSIPGKPGPRLSGPITRLRGGCAGQDTPRSSGVAVQRGHGGGAVLLIAGRAITITGGGINAAGEGGEGGSSGGGGGGGGSGGMIVLDAPTIASDGLILASGGGGGGGDGDTSAGGGPGADPSTVNAAAGGKGGTAAGGRGGDGSPSSSTASGGDGTQGALSSGVGNGGGGGGGTGIVKAPAAASLGLQVSPRQTP